MMRWLALLAAVLIQAAPAVAWAQRPDPERWKAEIEVVEKRHGAESAELATVLHKLGNAAHSQARYDDALAWLERSLAIRRKVFGAEHRDVAASLGDLGILFQSLYRHEEAESALTAALAMRERLFGAEHPAVASSLHNLGLLRARQGRSAEAERLYKRALAIFEKRLGPGHDEVARTATTLGRFYIAQGRFLDAEPLIKRALAIREKTAGDRSRPFAVTLAGMATLYWAHGRYAEAERLFDSARATLESLGLGDSPDFATVTMQLGEVRADLGRNAEAEALFRQALAIRERLFGPRSPPVATSLHDLGLLLHRLERYSEAEALLERALAIRTAFADEFGMARVFDGLAMVQEGQGRLAESRAYFERSLAIREKARLPDRDVARALNNLAYIHMKQGRTPVALDLTRRASALYRNRILESGDATHAKEVAANRHGFLRHLALVSARRDFVGEGAATEESFTIGQLAQFTSASAAVAKMAVRFASGDDALAGLVKQRQDLVDRRSAAETEIVRAVSQPPSRRVPNAEARLREELANMDREIQAIDARLRKEFPQYPLLIRPEPLGIAAVQKLLRPDEAMVAYCLDADEGWLWVVRPQAAAFMRLTIGERALSEKIRGIRRQVQPDERGNVPLIVDVRALHEIYAAVFAPAVEHLRDVRHVIVVPAGALTSLPFAMLVATAPAEIKSNADYARVEWLARRYAISVLPSVGSIRALREFAASTGSKEPFAGFGDPQLTDTGSARKERAAAPSLRTVFPDDADAQRGLADVRAIKGVPSLPETADELHAMAQILKADRTTALWLRGRATEANVKSADLSRYRVIAFATHGVMAGELAGIAEPGLILTPPAQASADDDGYLSASEIARLRLDAEWVLLSACNTAAADGTPGAEGLSGLARAFFYAGSRSLLVSHWPVASEATVPLTTTMLRELEANPAAGKAEAHRKAMLALMATPSRPEYAHPFFWAPFVVVGEAGGR